MNAKDLTIKKAKEVLRQIKAEMPDAVNPQDPTSGLCLYTGQDGSHCIIGELFSRVSIMTTHSEAIAAHNSMGLFELGEIIGLPNEVIEYLGNVQCQADYPAPSGTTLPWGCVDVEGGYRDPGREIGW